MYSSQINIGTENQILPSHFNRQPPAKEYPNLGASVKIIDRNKLEAEPRPLFKNPKPDFRPVMRNLDESFRMIEDNKHNAVLAKSVLPSSLRMN